jgi:tRNA G46 methylase TrmB
MPIPIPTPKCQMRITCLIDVVSLAPVYPDKLLLGLEIRDKAAEYVADRIQRLRQQHVQYKAGTYTPKPSEPTHDHPYTNISVVHCNAMKYFPCYFAKGQVCVKVLAMRCAVVLTQQACCT